MSPKGKHQTNWSRDRQPHPADRAGSLRLTLLFVLSLLVAARHGLHAQGIPEPSMVLYGAVRDPQAGGIRVTFGPIVWVFRPAGGGTPVTITGVLTNINDQFSYVLRVPCETELAGVPISAGTLRLAANSTIYDRSAVTISGVPAAFAQPALTNLTLTSIDRGRIERIDLLVNLDLGFLLPVDWQLQYFGRTGIDPFADPDGDGMSNFAEYRAGTHPLDEQSRFELLRVAPRTGGGITVEWSSVKDKFYSVQRSSELLSGFVDVQTQIPGHATDPITRYTDVNAVGSGTYFYRVRVE